MDIVFSPANTTIKIGSGCEGIGNCGRCKVCCLLPEGDMAAHYAGSLKRKEEISAGIQSLPVNNGYSGAECFGLSFDAGTTTVVGMLFDLVSGELLGVKAETNPQTAYGADVISRIMFAGKSRKNLLLMQEKILECLSGIAKSLTESRNIPLSNIYEVTIAGNTTMSHLITGTDPKTLAVAPFKPVFCESAEKNASEFGIKVNPDAKVTLLSNIAGHVGSDITAGILASGIARKKGVHLLIDVGTNGEIVLAYDGKLFACSTAAGPAFEGASIYQGMRAALGAVERVDITDDEVLTGVIGGADPAGICGSGILDAVSEMLKAGAINKTGRILTADKARLDGVPEKIASRIREGKTGREFVLAYRKGADDIVITQKDIREVQLAKSAIQAGINIMLKEAGLDEEDIDKLYIAGAFGNHIRAESAVRAGLIPDIGYEKIVYAGNTAGIGAAMALLSADARDEAEKTAKAVRHVELAENPSFQEVYIAAMAF